MRKIIFWIHLVCGVITGVVIFSMSITGVILTYERQINQWIAEGLYVPVSEQVNRLSLEQLNQIRKVEYPDIRASQIVLTNHPGAPVMFRAGRFDAISLNPYSGQAMNTESESLSNFWTAITRFHRWFGAEGESRDIARQVTGVSNLAFLFLVLSGLYLWLPTLFRWTMFKARLLFRKNYPNNKVRDYHWHHIFGIWAAIPLIFIVYTGAMFNYEWTGDLIYSALGADRPVRGSAGDQPQNVPAVIANPLSLDSLVDQVLADTGDDWNRLSISLPGQSDERLRVDVDRGNGAQAQKRHTLSLDRSTGAIIETRVYADLPVDSKIQGITRFGHTGEMYGFIGQTIAGLASLAALFMVWTGFALSWRRLIQPLMRKH